MDNSNIINMLNKIDSISKEIKDDDYKNLLENLNELKKDYDKIKKELEKVKPKYFIELGFKIKYNKYYSNKFNYSTIYSKSMYETINYRTKLSKEEIFDLSKILDVDMEGHANIINNNISSIIINVLNISNSLSRRHLTYTKICEECLEECDCDCEVNTECYDEKFLDIINENSSITLNNITFKGDDWIHIGRDAADVYDYMIDKGKYFKDYMDRYTFKTYIEKIMKWVDDRI